MNTSFEEMSAAYAVKLAGKTAEVCQMHPRGHLDAWSTQHVIEHLVLTYRGTTEQVEKYLRRGSSTERKADWKQFAARVLVLKLGRLPRGQTAPKFVRPGLGGLVEMSGEELGLVFAAELNLMDCALVRCEQTFGGREFAPHFRLGPLSAQQWRKFHLVHGWHHLAQLDRISDAIENPASR